MDIEYLLWLQGIREAAGPFIEWFMNLISHICDGAGIALVPCLIYWIVDKRAGMFVMTSIAIGGNLNQLVKNTACVYRPWVRDARVVPSAEALGHATGYSFPSGHSQTAGCTFGAVAWRWRERRWLAAACIVLALAVGFTRNFLGVHTPQDVIVGLAESVFVVWLAGKVVAKVADGSVRDTTVLAAGVAAVALILVYTELKPYPLDLVDGVPLVDPAAMRLDAYSQAGILLGAVAGWFLERRFLRFSTEIDGRQKIVRLVVCALVVGAFAGMGQLVKLAFGRGIAYAAVKGLLPAFSGVYLGPAVSALVERRFAQRRTAANREA